MLIFPMILGAIPNPQRDGHHGVPLPEVRPSLEILWQGADEMLTNHSPFLLKSMAMDVKVW